MKIESLKAFPFFLICVQDERRRSRHPARANRAAECRVTRRNVPQSRISTADPIEMLIPHEATASNAGNYWRFALKEIQGGLMDRNFKKETLRFASEELLIDCLRETYYTHAPVHLSYSDGCPIPSQIVDRIHQKLHQA